MKALGLNIGSTSLKAVVVDMENDQFKIESASVVAHNGDIPETVHTVLKETNAQKGIKSLVTGTSGRFLFNLPNTPEAVCIEEALIQLNKKENLGKIDAVISLGGEDLVLYKIDEHYKVTNNLSGSKCASGTGEFFKQQLARMNMKLDDVNGVSESAQVYTLSTRCSVFMKSDCTHRLNKSEATKEDIVLSLSNVMAIKVSEFLQRAKISKGRVVLAGGLTLNKHLLRFIKEKLPNVEVIVPKEAAYFEALGAAFLAAQAGAALPEESKLLHGAKSKFTTLDNLNTAKDKVTYYEHKRGKIRADGEYALGIDGGSTTTKVALVDIETNEIVASYYGRTHGNPVQALKNCIIEIKKQIAEQIGEKSVKISLCATTGSSREILGVYAETSGVYNEIIAHAKGTAFFDKDVDTIFEIGGQDAKYVLLKNGVPIDYAMNEACSAGTGSFLEESASGDLNISRVEEIGDIALKAEHPLKFGEHCSAFINSDIRTAISQGASKEDITAGIICSIVSNYLNRVVGNRNIGQHIFLQGGVAKNKAIPLAFAMLLNKNILVPPSPELTGCFGVVLLAKQKVEEGLLDKGIFDLDAILQTQMVQEGEFRCKSCENNCEIKRLTVNGHKYNFGGRCNLYANTRKKKADSEVVRDFVQERMDLMFVDYAPKPEDFKKKHDFTVGIPMCFSVYSMYPLYAHFFNELGIKTVLSQKISAKGVARVESAYCFPAEIAHGAVQDLLDKGCDYLFIPHFRDLESNEEKVHANFCPITQSLPYYIEKAFPEIDTRKILSTVVSFKYGDEKAYEHFSSLGKQLDISESEIRAAFTAALQKQKQYEEKAKELGKQALEYAKTAKQPVIAVLGRPYNAFTKDANMGIPRKFTSRGYTVVPFDILPVENTNIFDNMYWYYGQMDVKASFFLKDEPNIFVTYITNFSCAPDSFILHYLRWAMGTKPFLVLELDSHSADAGIDTRVEAFLDIIDGYKTKITHINEERYDNGLQILNEGKDGFFILNKNTGKKEPVKNNPKAQLLLSNMGELSTEYIAAILRGTGFNSKAMPKATARTLQFARNHASGKECVPSHLVLGSFLEFYASKEYDKNMTYILFVPITTGPCRTGQYYIYYQNLFRDLRIPNVVVMILSADNSYTEIGPNFSKQMWKSMVVSDYVKDIQTTLRATAENPAEAMKIFKDSWKDLLEAAEKDDKAIYTSVAKIANITKTIKLKRNPKECPKVLVVGEIYVRRDDFAVDEIIQICSDRGIIAKVSGITEWIHYLDFVRKYALTKELKLLPWYKRAFSKPAMNLLKLKIEKAYKHTIENKVKKLLAPCGLVPHVPHNMEKIMKNAENYFITHELNSEIVISSGVGATAMEEDFSGIINISPFACLIGRVIEGLFSPWAREKGYPMISIEVDGNQLPPNTLNKLEIFTVNVRRFKKNVKLGELIQQ